MRRHIVALMLFMSLFGRPVHAQAVHPCDLPPQTTPTKGNKIGWCHDLRDDDGLPVAIVAFKVYIADQNADLGVVAPVSQTQNAQGLYYFEAVLPAGYPRGSFPVFLTAYVPGEVGESAHSNTIVWQRGGPPNQPKNPHIAVIIRTDDGALAAVLRPVKVAVPRQ